MKFGMLLPHFGEECNPTRVIHFSKQLEDMGYDSVWVRDHLLWKPHEMEGKNRTFIEPFVVLSGIAALTQRIELGTAVLIPIRWPLKVAQNFASLSYVAGGRVHAGFGLGSNQAELGAAGFRVEDREKIFMEMAEICKEVWARDDVSWQGEMFSFEKVTIQPKPAAPVQTWYGGTTRASVRRAVAHCDGWLPGRLPMATLDNRLALLSKLGAEQGKKMKSGVIPLISIDEDRDKARANIDVHALATSSAGSNTWIKPPSGEFRTVEDLEGLLLAGTPDDCVREVQKFVDRGVDHFIFDLRLQFDRYEEKAELIARKVLPHFRQ